MDLVDALQELIGRHCRHEQCHCEIIEILEEGPSIVLYKHSRGEIQCNWFGEAQRRAPKTYTVPLISRLDNDLHPVVRAVTDEAEQTRLRALTGLTQAADAASDEPAS